MQTVAFPPLQSSEYLQLEGLTSKSSTYIITCVSRAKKRVLVFKSHGAEEEQVVVEEGKNAAEENIEIWTWVTQLGLETSLPIAFGVIIGRELDSRFGIKPKMTLSLLFFGIIISFYNLFKRLQSIK